MKPSRERAVVEYLTEAGRSPFGEWFDELDPSVAARVTIAIARLAGGNVSQVRSVQEGVLELKLQFGPGYRIYFGLPDHGRLVLLGGGSKARQSSDIRRARVRWDDYRRRMVGESEKWH